MIPESLFHDPHHYRADCRTFAMWVRHGGIDHLTPAERSEVRLQLDKAWLARKAHGFPSGASRHGCLKAYLKAAEAVEASGEGGGCTVALA